MDKYKEMAVKIVEEWKTINEDQKEGVLMNLAYEDLAVLEHILDMAAEVHKKE
jgi:hypothetical protein